MRILLITLLLIPLVCLGNPNSYTCFFTSFSNKEGLHKTTDNRPYIIKINGGNAVFGTEGDKYEFKVVFNKYNISMYQVTPAGNLNSITIDKNMKIVYSRNTTILGKLSPSQYYGSCKNH